MFRFITNKPFWANLLAAIGLVILLMILFFSSLSFITKHNKNVKVPSVTGKNIDEARRLLEAQGFDVEVQDSVYVDNTPKLSVTKQLPDADLTVKEGRTVYLTINRAVAPLVDMPDLRGFSFLSAKLYLQSLGLKLGSTSYKPDIAKNSVLEMAISGKPLTPGTKINMGSTVDFVLGSGEGSAELSVPELIGMTVAEARSYISSMNVSLGAVTPEGGETVADNESAFITRQNPMPYEITSDGSKSINKIKAGQIIDVYVSGSKPARDTLANPN